MTKQDLFLKEFRELLDKHNVQYVSGNRDCYGYSEDGLLFSFKGEDKEYLMFINEDETTSVPDTYSHQQSECNFFYIWFYNSLNNYGKSLYDNKKLEVFDVHSALKRYKEKYNEEVKEEHVQEVINRGCC